jgi:hypothetical protein
MNRRLVAAIVAAVAVSACADDREQSPTGPGSATTPDYLVGATCNYTDVKKYARNLFGSTGNGTKLAGELAKFAKDSPQATAKGFDIFAEIAAKRDGGPWTAQNVEDAARLTEQVIYCADVVLTAGTTNLLANLRLALSKPTGAYAVPLGTSSGSVLTTDKQSGVQPDNTTWGNWLGSRTLVYGYPLTTTIAGESTEGVIGSPGYDWSLVRAKPLPALVYNGPGKVTVCLTVEVEAANQVEAQLLADKFRVQKTASILEVATDVSGVECLVRTASVSLPEKLFNYAARLVAPTELHAAAFAGLRTSTSPTGSAGSFSPFQGGNPGSTVLTWDNEPADGTVASVGGEDGTAIRVLARGEGNTPWTGVRLHIYGIDNNGAKTEFSNSCATTLDTGIATFTGLAAPKTGGFRLFVETGAAICGTDASVTNYAPSTLEATDRIVVRP